MLDRSQVELTPRISVVIPAYNESELLPACLQSLKAQDFEGPFEIVVVDNGSTDGTVDVAHQYGVRVVIEPIKGVCWARQCGTLAARGEVVISTDADTTFAVDWLRRIDASFAADPATVLVGGPVQFVDAPVWAKLYPRILFWLNTVFAQLRGRPFYISACNVAFKKSAWDGYNTQLTQAGDELDLLRRMRHRGRTVFDNHNPTFTSARRLRRGLVYSLFVTFLTYYLLDFVIGRFTKRSFFGSFPPIRTQSDVVKGRFERRAFGVLLLLVVSGFPPLRETSVHWFGDVLSVVRNEI